MRRLWLLFAQAVTVTLAFLLVVQTLKPHWLAGLGAVAPRTAAVPVGSPPLPPPTPAALPRSAAILSYHEAAQRAAPAVVSIVASKASAARNAESDEWFRFFFGDRAPRNNTVRPQVGLGSGVIVSNEGYLLTNNHVVEGADAVEVQLPDGREAQARIVGTDPETDLAVLKIDLPGLPSIGFGDSNALRVGDVVLAIGNPFNVGQTVTSGIVSALGRNRLGLSTFENFIQTDAAINPGNSGGALVDTAGALVGINTAIFSRSGGSQGIGFAVPTDIAQQVLTSLIKDGQVRRGWIGVEPRELSEEMVQTLKLPVAKGVLVASVVLDGPADRAGLRPGDVITRVGERPVGDTTQLMSAVAALPPQSQVSLAVQRGAEPLKIDVAVAQRPAASRPQARGAR